MDTYSTKTKKLKQELCHGFYQLLKKFIILISLKTTLYRFLYVNIESQLKQRTSKGSRFTGLLES